jgi:site-specific DNA recombinase
MKTLAYIRISNSGQAETGFSIQNQKDRIVAYCAYNGFDTPVFFADEGFTGRNQNRPGLQQLINTIETEKVENVIIYALTRLGRNTIQTLQLIEKFNKKGIFLHSLSEKLDTSTAIGKFFVTTIAALAQLESDQISERTSSVLLNKKSKLETYSQAPYGLRIIGREVKDGKVIHAGSLIPDQTESPVIKIIFDRNTYPEEIKNFLNSQNIKPKKANQWSRNNIVNILKNKPIYIKAGIIPE